MVLNVKIAPKVKTFNADPVLPFEAWRKHISKKCNPKKHLTAPMIERVYI